MPGGIRWGRGEVAPLRSLSPGRSRPRRTRTGAAVSCPDPAASGGARLKPASPRAAAIGLVLVNLAWAAGYPLTAIALRDIPAGLLTLLRLLGGALLVTALVRPGRARWDRAAYAYAAALGVVGFALPVYLQTLGLARSSPALTAILVSLEPLLTAVLSAGLLGQRLPAARRAALGIALGGAWLIAGRPRPGHPGFLVGDLLLGLSVLCFAAYNAFSSRLTDRVPAVEAAAATLWVGVVATVPLWLLGGAHLPRAVSAGPLAATAFLALVGTGLAYLAWVAGLQALPSAQVALYLYLQPVFGVLLSVLWTGAHPTAGFYAGAALILFSVFLGGEGRSWPWRPARVDSG